MSATDAAALEDRVVVYSAAEKKYCAGLLADFAKRHPGIAVEFHEGISVALHERHLAELAADTPAADILWSSAMDLQMRLVQDGQALAYRSPEASALAQGAVHRGAHSSTLEPLLTLVNRNSFDANIPAGSLAEIAAAVGRDPAKFRGRVACYDIERNGLGFLALLLEKRRSADFDACISTLARCEPKIFGSNPLLVEEVASGRAALGYHVLESYALRAVASCPALAIAASNAPSLAISRIALISSRAPHPNAAKLFLDYLLSQDGQRELQQAGLSSIRTASGAQRATHIAPLRIDDDFRELLDPERRRGLLAIWRAAIGGAAHEKSTQ